MLLVFHRLKVKEEFFITEILGHLMSLLIDYPAQKKYVLVCILPHLGRRKLGTGDLEN